MATFDSFRQGFAPSRTANALRVLVRLAGNLAAWNDARITRKALSALSAHELEDIGLGRGDIDEIVRRHNR